MQTKMFCNGMSHARNTRPMRCTQNDPQVAGGFYDGHVVDLEEGRAFRVVFGVGND